MPGVTDMRVAMTAEKIAAHDRRDRQRQGRRRQVDRRRQPRGRAGADGQARSAWSTPTSTAPRSPGSWAMRSRPELIDQQIVPVPTHGVRMLSIGQLIEPGTAVAWRGPMAASALGQPDGRRLGRLRIADRRPAARHRRRPDDPDPEMEAGRRGDRLDAAGPVADRRDPRDRHVPQDGRAGDRPDREHGRLCLPALRRGQRPVRQRRRGGGGRRDGDPLPRPHPARTVDPRGLRRRPAAGRRRRRGGGYLPRRLAVALAREQVEGGRPCRSTRDEDIAALLAGDAARSR